MEGPEMNDESKSKDEIREDIDYFFNFFKDRVKFIKQHCLNKVNGRIEGILLCSCCIDALAVNRYGGRSKCAKFAKFITKYSGLEHTYDKISLPLLKQSVESETNQDSKNKELVEFLKKDLGVNIRKYHDTSYNVDIPYQELEKKIRTKFGNKYFTEIRDKITKFRYSNIFWEHYRCASVHKLSHKGEPANLAKKEEPYYFVWSSLNTSKSQIQFGIPIVFMLKTLENCIENWRKECMENAFSPLCFKGAKED
jgi:hypothetical protein